MLERARPACQAADYGLQASFFALGRLALMPLAGWLSLPLAWLRWQGAGWMRSHEGWRIEIRSEFRPYKNGLGAHSSRTSCYG